jgi:hypothetical protein
VHIHCKDSDKWRQCPPDEYKKINVISCSEGARCSSGDVSVSASERSMKSSLSKHSWIANTISFALPHSPIREIKPLAAGSGDGRRRNRAPSGSYE